MIRGTLAIATLGIVLCIGCGGNDADTDAEGNPMNESVDRQNTFRVAIRTFGPFQTAIAREWDSFRAESGSPLELELVAMDHQPLYEALLPGGGLKGGDWDVALLNTDWLAEAHRSDAVLDLGPYIKQNPPLDYPQGWTDSLLRLQRFGEKVTGLPYHDGPECLIYRTDMLEDDTLRQVYLAKYGRPLEVPQTWAEFVRVAEFLNRPEDRMYGTAFAAYPDGHNTVYDVCLQLWTRGGELLDQQGKIQLNTPQMVRALSFYRRVLNNKLAVHPQCRQFDSVGSGEAFLRGEVVMMVNWFGFAAVCQTGQDSKVKGRVAIAPVPHGPDGPSASLNCYWLLSAASGSPHQQTAYGFIRHCMGRLSDKRRALDGVIGCRKSTWADEEVNRAVPFYGQMEALHKAARELPRKSNWTRFAAIIDRMAIDAIDGDTPIETIAAEAQKEVDKLQSKNP